MDDFVSAILGTLRFVVRTYVIRQNRINHLNYKLRKCLNYMS